MIKDIVSKCPFEFMLNYETTFVSDDYQRRETYKEQSSSKLEALYMSPSSGHSVALFPLSLSLPPILSPLSSFPKLHFAFIC